MTSTATLQRARNANAKDEAIERLLYISQSTFPGDQAANVTASIVDTAHRRNPPLGLTGALLFTGTHFAQIIEGKADAVERLMAALRHDARHVGLQVVDRQIAAQRRFSSWSMAYFGPSQFVSRHVTRLLGEPSPADQRRAAEWLTELLCEFAAS